MEGEENIGKFYRKSDKVIHSEPGRLKRAVLCATQSLLDDKYF
jgi:hypothetical protein